MLHPDILTISYRHRHEIKKSLKDVLGYLGIDHFSLDLIRPDGEMLFFSGTPSHGYELCSRGYGAHDATVSPEYYTKREFYWWDEVKHKKFSNEINYYRNARFGFSRGFMMVRHWDGFYFIYSLATRDKTNKFIDKVHDSLDSLFEAGDEVYNSMRSIYSEYTGAIEPPVINKFFPYQGGAPLVQHSCYKKNEHGILLPQGLSAPVDPVHLKLVVDNTL